MQRKYKFIKMIGNPWENPSKNKDLKRINNEYR